MYCFDLCWLSHYMIYKFGFELAPYLFIFCYNLQGGPFHRLKGATALTFTFVYFCMIGTTSYHLFWNFVALMIKPGFILLHHNTGQPGG